MEDNFVVIRGPLSEDDLREIVGVVQRAEARHPDALFTVVVNEPDASAEAALDKLARVNRGRPGYLRSVEVFEA